MLDTEQPQSSVNQGEVPHERKSIGTGRRKNPQVEENRDAKPKRRKKVGAKREKGDALVIKTEKSKYSDVLKAMRSDATLVDLGADVSSIRRTITGQMILELKRDKERKGAAYKNLTEEVLGEGVEESAHTAEATLKVINLDEVIEPEELVTTLRQQCDVQMATAAVQLRKGPAGTQVALVQLPVADVKSPLK